MLKAPPVNNKDIYSQLIYREIKSLLDRILFSPVLAIATSTQLSNAPASALTTALKSGTITYADGYFTGKFNAAIGLEIRKIGGSFNKLRKAYYLPIEEIPTEIKIAIAKGKSIIQEKISKINERLNYLQQTGSVEPINFSPQFSGILIDIDKQFKTTLPTDIGIPMTLTPFMRASIEREYTHNLNKYITDMTVESTQRLREKIIKNVSEGYRASNLVGVIQAQQGVSHRHAKFLAKQETSLMVSSYRDSRYKEAAIDEWVWSSSHDERVRPLHRKLNGQKFSFNNLPIIDERTGEKGTPGQAYGCRCSMIPLISTDKYKKLGKDANGGQRFEIIS